MWLLLSVVEDGQYFKIWHPSSCSRGPGLHTQFIAEFRHILALQEFNMWKMHHHGKQIDSVIFGFWTQKLHIPKAIFLLLMIYLPYNRGFTNITGVLDINTTKCIVPLLRSSYYAGTMPAKIVPPLTSAFPEGGFRNRAGTFCYKDHLHKCDVPILALAESYCSTFLPLLRLEPL